MIKFLTAFLACLLFAGAADAAETNVYWRVDLNQGSSIIAYGQGATEPLAWEDCFRLRKITRAMTAVETRKSAVAAITTSAVRWCKNPMQYATVKPDPVAPPPVDCVVSDWSAWTVGNWSACVGGQQSRPEARTRSIAVQPANGGTACPALSETRTVSQACGGSATLSWTPPTANTDGTSLSNLAGYRISYGTNRDALVQTIQIANPGVSTYTVGNLSPGTWYFAVRAYRTDSVESVNSNTGSKAVP